MHETPENKHGWRVMRRILIGLAIFATLVAIFYTEEDWRGQRGWENCKQELEAKGMVLDWDKYIPPPVPDDQNFFTASTNILLRFRKPQTDAETRASSQCSWLRIEYSTNAFPILDTTNSGPLVVAKIIILLRGATSLEQRTNNLTVALNDSTARERVRDLLQRTIGESANGSAGFLFSEFQLTNIRPAQIFIPASATPSPEDLAGLIPLNTLTNIGRLRVVATVDKQVYQVVLTGVRITWAADYLKWSDQFVPALDEVREALKRPYAMLPGDYSQPYLMPIPNFVTMRSVVQTLAQRTQCYLLLGEPDRALPEMTLMHDICRILEKPPTGQPMTLVEVMINVAITGLYADTMADGLRLHAWREPQLAAFQEELETVNLPPLLVEDMRGTMPADECRDLEIMPLPKLLSINNSKMNWLPKVGLWLVPRGWVYQNMVSLARLVQKMPAGFDLANNTVSPRLLDTAWRDVEFFIGHKSPYRFLATFGIPNYRKALQTTTHNQTLANEAQIACALERYRLAHGEYPETLDALVPQFIEQLPHDIIGGQPLRYHRTNDGKFLLYSVGWNETDDGGRDGGIDFTQGDWVWKN
jgi:hypothetical protein